MIYGSRGIFMKLWSKVTPPKILLFSLLFLTFNCKYLSLTKMDLSVFVNKLFVYSASYFLLSSASVHPSLFPLPSYSSVLLRCSLQYSVDIFISLDFNNHVFFKFQYDSWGKMTNILKSCLSIRIYLGRVFFC